MNNKKVRVTLNGYKRSLKSNAIVYTCRIKTRVNMYSVYLGIIVQPVAPDVSILAKRLKREKSRILFRMKVWGFTNTYRSKLTSPLHIQNWIRICPFKLSEFVQQTKLPYSLYTRLIFQSGTSTYF